LDELTQGTDYDAPPRSLKRAKWAWKLFKAKQAERRGDYDGGLRLLNEAAHMKPLWAPERVLRAMLLLRSQRLPEAQAAFASLRKDFEGSDDPDLQYLRRFCTAMLGVITGNSLRLDYEAKQAHSIPCKARLRERFPLDVREED